MPNLSNCKTPMPIRDASERRRDFQEVALGYTAEQAIEEAGRCLQCKHKPCTEGCPVQVDIPAFIRCVAEGDFAAAYEVISRSSSLPAVCGRVCPQENQCEKRCVRGVKGEPVAIGRLERFVADWHNQQPLRSGEQVTPNGHKAAVIGSGPAGLACAGDLLKKGYDVYITADHGNAPCVGMGKLMKTGVEVETKSRRIVVIKDFADKESLLSTYGMIEYPKYYLSKENDYLICAAGTSFDSKGDDVMSHGGITLDEVIVPFITIKAVENNG